MLPPAIAASATYSIWRRPSEKALHVQSSGTLLTMAMKVLMSGGAPQGTPMHNCTITGPAMRPSSTSDFACQRWPVSKASISARTPRSEICRDIARSIAVEFVMM